MTGPDEGQLHLFFLGAMLDTCEQLAVGAGQTSKSLSVDSVALAVTLRDQANLAGISDKHLMATSLEHLIGPKRMSAGLNRNQTRWQTLEFMTEGGNGRGQEAASDDSCLVVQNAKVALAVAKIDTNRHSSNEFSFSKNSQRSNVRVLRHSRALLFLRSLRACQAAYCIEAHRPSHPILIRRSGRSRHSLRLGRAVRLERNAF